MGKNRFLDKSSERRYVGSKPPQVGMRKTRLVADVAVIRAGRKLIGARQADVADQSLGIEGIIVGETSAEFFQKRFIARRI